MGAVTGAQDFLKTVANAKINPPMDPRIARPAACSGERDVRFQAQAAVPIAKINNSPVLLTVPVRVIVSPRAMPSPRKVLSFSVGFEVRIRFAIRALLEQTIVTSRPLWMIFSVLARLPQFFPEFSDIQPPRQAGQGRTQRRLRRESVVRYVFRQRSSRFRRHTLRRRPTIRDSSIILA